MKEIKISKKKSGNKITVNVELPARKFVHEPIMEFSNTDLINYLKEEGINLKEYKISESTESVLTSYATKNNPPRLKGSWTLTKPPARKSRTTKKMNKEADLSFNNTDIEQKGD